MTDREVLAWRNIGAALRLLQELGFHNSTSLQQQFPSITQRQSAKRLLWCAYTLDRRWSFGTGLPFGIAESNIDYDMEIPVRFTFPPVCYYTDKTLGRPTVVDIFEEHGGILPNYYGMSQLHYRWAVGRRFYRDGERLFGLSRNRMATTFTAAASTRPNALAVQSDG